MSADDRSKEQRCQCVSCAECRGSGTVWFSFGGKTYLGNNRCDDLDELQTCEECRGSGISEVCDYCYDRYEESMEELY